MSFKIQSNFERKTTYSETINTNQNMDTIERDDRLVESLRVLVKEFLEIVRFLFLNVMLDF